MLPNTFRTSSTFFFFGLDLCDVYINMFHVSAMAYYCHSISRDVSMYRIMTRSDTVRDASVALSQRICGDHDASGYHTMTQSDTKKNYRYEKRSGT